MSLSLFSAAATYMASLKEVTILLPRQFIAIRSLIDDSKLKLTDDYVINYLTFRALMAPAVALSKLKVKWVEVEE